MEPVLFYGVPQGCSFGSIVALEWLNQPYRLCRINMLDVSQIELFSRVNPIRQTPALLLAEGTILTQSAAILQNIASRGLGQGLGFAQGTPEYDHLNQRLAFLATTFFSSFAPLWKAYKMEANPPVLELLRDLGRADVSKAHAQLEAMLASSSSEWLAGDQRTIADAYFIGLARWATYHRIVDQREYPRLHRLVQRLEADPAVIFAHAIEDERTAASAGGFRGHIKLEDLQPRLAA